ncbi:MAG TPA: TerC family protein [Candidatus Eisenbacteria bacterium]|nr:TerC family protein [Candidatus Eisenbacteria bacterium]
MDPSLWKWIGFFTFVLAMLALDVCVFHRRPHEVRYREAIGWTVVWVALAMGFNTLIYFYRGRTPALEFFAGYLVEESLSVDNLFVFLLIFRYFGVRSEFQHDVLFWGILGAIVFRGIFIGAGVALIHRFDWLTYVFGAFLVYTGCKLAFEEEKEVHPDTNPVLRAVRRFIPVTQTDEGNKFFVTRDKRLFATPLFIVLVMVETTDIIFAVDSVPAVLAVTRDPFIVYTSNVFAILGLRSLYFVLAGLLEKFHYLNYGLSVVLSFVGVKMLIEHHYKIPIHVSLAVIAGVLAVSIAASLIWPKKEPQP